MADPAEANIWAMHRDFARVTGAELHDDPDALWFTLPSPNSWLNGASWTNLDPENAGARIDEIVREIHGRGRNILWAVTPSCRPDTLPQLLEERGFTSSRSTAMVADLAAVPALSIPGLEIIAAESESEVLDWVNTFDRGMVGIEPRGEAHPWLSPFSELYLGDAGSRLFVAMAGGELVACSLAVIGGGAVGLYGVATVPEHRGKGYGAAITAAGLHWGRDQGETAGILHATAMGLPVYRRLGFEPTWELQQWLLPAPQ